MNPSMVQADPRLTKYNIVQAVPEFKVLCSWSKPLKNHLIGGLAGPQALIGRPHRPGQEWKAEDMPRDPGRRRGQVVDPVGDKIRPRSKRVLEVPHALALGGRCLWPIGFGVVALGD